MGYCIVHNPLLLQPLRHWSTFISRKYEHLAVEDFIVKVLHDSRGSRLFTLALLPSLCFYYSTLLAICQEVFLITTCFFSRLLPTPFAVRVLSLATRGWWKVVATPWNRTFEEVSFRTLVLLYSYYITGLSTCQEFFLFFFEIGKCGFQPLRHSPVFTDDFGTIEKPCPLLLYPYCITL